MIALLTNTTVINNFLLIGFIFCFAYLFMRESNNPKSPIDWRDLLIDTKTKKMSVGKFGQFWGIAVSTWVIITLSQVPEAFSIFPIIFPMYLAFIGGTWSYSAYLKTKQSESTEGDK